MPLLRRMRRAGDRRGGWQLDALFPPKPIEHGKRQRRPFDAAAVLQALSEEVRIAAFIACDLAKGKALSETDRQRLLVAAGRIESGREIANG